MTLIEPGNKMEYRMEYRMEHKIEQTIPNVMEKNGLPLEPNCSEMGDMEGTSKSRVLIVFKLIQ